MLVVSLFITDKDKQYIQSHPRVPGQWASERPLTSNVQKDFLEEQGLE